MDRYRRLRDAYELASRNFLEFPNDLEAKESWEKIQPIMETYKQWMKEADRQMFIKEYKASLKKDTVYELQKIALTVCPDEPESSTHEILYRILDIIRTLSSVQDFRAVMEQRSEDNEPERGWHLHLSVDTTYPPSKVRQFLLQKLKTNKICALVFATKQYNSKWEENYMDGNKYNVGKNKKVLKDRVLRENYAIPSVIKKNNSL